MKKLLRLSVNGKPREDAVAENALLLDYLRDTLGLTGTKQGCDGGECGACTVLVDSQPRLACSTLAHSVAGRTVYTGIGEFPGSPERHRREIQATSLRWP